MSLSSVQIKMLRRLLVSGTEEKIAHALEKIHPADLTILFSEITPNETQRLIDSLFLLAKAGRTILELPEFLIPDILELIEDKRLAAIISRLEPDDGLFLLESVPESRWRVILENLPQRQRSSLDKLLLYPKNSAGSAMTSNLVRVNVEMSAEEAIENIRKHPEEGIFYIYVVDDGNRLVGVQSLRNLVTCQRGTKVCDIMNQDVHAVLATAPQEEAAEIVSQYNLLAVPVVNETRELLGVITVDDVIDMVEEEATEDIYHLAGLSEVDRALTPLWVKVKKRIPWMLLNLVTAGLAALIIGMFERSIEEVVALAIFLPVLANVGGNGAIQSLTVISRSIALGEFSFIKTYKVILKEVGNGLLVGLIAGILMGIMGYLWKGNIYLGFVLFASTALTLVVGGLSGAIVPVAFNKLKLDPAVGTSVLVTLITDGFAFLFILGLATLMLSYLT